MNTLNQTELLNTLIELEEQINELWNYHQDNENCIDVVAEFDNLQKNALHIEQELKEKG